MDKNFFHNHFIYKHRKGIALLLLIGFLGSPLGILPARAADTAAAGDTQSKGLLQGLILDPMKTFFSGLASFNYGDFLKLIIKDSLNTVVDRFYSQVVKSFEDEYLVQDYNRQVFVPYLDFGFAKFHNWVADQVGDAKIDAPLLNAFLGLENLAYRGLKETGTKLSHSVLKELDQVSKEMRGENSPPSPSDHDYMSKLMSGLWGNPHDLFWGAAGKTLDVGASSEAQGGQDYLISEGHNNGRKVTDMPEEIESYFLKKGDVLTAPAPTTANPLPFPSALGKKLQDWGYTRIFSPANGAVSGYSLASKGTYYLHDSAPFGLEIWSWDANFPFFLLCSKSGDNYVIDGMRTLTKPNVWQDPQEVYPASIAFTSRAISDPLASGWTGLIKRPGQKVKVMVNDLIESKLKIAGDASDLSGVSRIIYDLGKTYLTNVNFKVKRATSGALNGCPIGFEVIEPDLGTTMGRMGEPKKPSAGQCLIAALKQVDTNFLGEVVGWVSKLGQKLICWIFDLGDKNGDQLTKEGNGIDTQNYIMVPNQGSLEELKNNDNDPKLKEALNNLDPADLEALNKTREEAAKTDPNGFTPLLGKNSQTGELEAQTGSIDRRPSLFSVSTLAQLIVYEELIKPLLPPPIEGLAKQGLGIIGTGLKWLATTAVTAVAGQGAGDVAENWVNEIGSYLSDSGAMGIMTEAVNFYAYKSGIRKVLELLNFCNLKPEENQIKTETVNLPTGGRYDFLEFPYRLTEKSNVTVGIYLRPSDTAKENTKLYRKLVFNNMPAGVHIARWDLSTDLSLQERNQIWNEITKSVYINVVFQKEVNGALQIFQEYILPEVKEEQFWKGEKYNPDPTTAAKNCHKESYSDNGNPCGSGYLAQNYMLELPQDPLADQGMPVLQRPFAPTPTFYQNQDVRITMRYNNDGLDKPADNVYVTLYDLAGVEGSADGFFGSANFYTGDLAYEAESQKGSGNVKKVYEGLIQMPVNCPGYNATTQPGCQIGTGPVTWTAGEDGAHALMMVFGSDQDQNKINNRIVQIVNVSKAPVVLEKYEMIDGPKTADLRGDGDHPDGDGTGVANPGEDIEIGVTLKDIRPVGSGEIDLELYIDLDNSSVFQYIGSGKNDSGDNKSSIEVKSVLSGDLIRPQDFNLRVKDDTKFSGDAKVPLYIRDQYGRTLYRQDLTVKVAPRCSDGVDNDGDGLIDFPADVWGCQNSTDNSEDDGNVLKKPDLVPVGMDYALVSECNDGIDNDRDGKKDYPDDTSCKTKDDISESGVQGVVQDSILNLKFKIKNQGDRAIPKGTVIPMGVYVCYGKPTTKTHHKTWDWSWNQGNHCDTPATDPVLSVDECYCESKSPASSGALTTYATYFENPEGSNQPSTSATDDAYKNYIDCIKEKYQRVTETPWTLSDEFDFYDEKRGSKGITEFNISDFEVREAKNMRFAVFADEKVDANFTEKEGVIPEFNERNNKAGLPDYFCEAGQDTAYLTLYNKDQCNTFPQATYKPERYLSMCMNSFYNATDYKIVVGDKGDWYKPATGTPSPSPFQYQYTCSSNDQCSSAASCNVDTVGDWNVNPGEYTLLTVKVKNTTNKDVKSYFTLTDGPGSKANIGSLTIPPLTSNPLLFESGEEKSLYFYVHIPPKSTDGHIYNNNDTINLTLKGRETKDSPEFIVAANLPIKLGQKLDARCLDKPKEVEPKPFVNLEMKDVTLAKSPNNPKKLTPGFQIKNGSSIGVPPLTNITYHYMLRYFKEEPTGTRDRGCYRTFDALKDFTKKEGIIATMVSGEVQYPLEYQDTSYTVGNTDEDYGFYQTFAQVDRKQEAGEVDDPDNFGCSDFVEVKKPDVEVTAVTLLKTMFTANQDTFTGTFTVKNNGSEEIPGNNIDYVWELYEGNNSEPVNKGTGNVGQKMPAGAVATIKLKNGGNIGVGYPDKSYSLVVEITVPDKYDEDKSNNNRVSAASSPLPVAGWSKTGANSQPNALTLTQRIKRVLNYVRAKFGD